MSSKMQKTSSSCSSSNHPETKYDVFISFRGKDVRKNFVGFLYKELEYLGIKAFLDEKGFKIGDDLYDLFKIIEESKFVIVVLSKDYASSKWCLRELTKIMESSETTQNRVVLPIFYRVEPSEIRNPSNPFLKKKFVKFKSVVKGVDDKKKQRKLDEIKRWKKAMKKITTRTGVVITKTSPQVDAVEKIARQIFDTILEESTQQQAEISSDIINPSSKVSTQETLVSTKILDSTAQESMQECLIMEQIILDRTLDELAQDHIIVDVGGQLYDSISQELAQKAIIS